MLLVGAAGYLFGWQVRENQGPSETNKKAQSGIHEDGHEDLHAPRESVNPSTAGTSSVGVHQPPPSSNDDESHDNTNPFTSDQQPESTAVEKSVEAPRILEFKDQCSPIGPSRDAANSTPGSHDLSSLTSNAILPESEQSAQNNESSVASVVAMAVDITGDNTANEREETSAISTANQEPQTGSQ